MLFGGSGVMGLRYLFFSISGLFRVYLTVLGVS